MNKRKFSFSPGNTRAAEGNPKNPPYTSTYTFTNDFPAVLSDPPVAGTSTTDPATSDLFQTQPTRGTCKVICFSPKHNLTMAEMSQDEIRSVIEEWVKVHDDLEATTDYIGYVQIFENKGAVMGCSNPHPHGQVK
jgi:UDPglucose--hexose-1-phosphate uridylyltransferase